MMAKLSGVESESTVSEFRETEKGNFCAVFTNSSSERVKLGSPMSEEKKKRDASAKLLFC